MTYRFGDFLLDAGKRSLLFEGTRIPLAKKPFDVLVYLVERADRVVSQAELLNAFWNGQDVYGDALRRTVSKIREALADTRESARFIETNWANGYRFVARLEVQSRSAPEPEIALEVAVQDNEENKTPAAESAIVALRQSIPVRNWRNLRRVFAAAFSLAVIIMVVMAVAGPALHHLRSSVASGRGPILPTGAKRNEKAMRSFEDAEYLLFNQRTPENMARAVDLYKQAIAQNPEFSDAYAGLSECYIAARWGYWNFDENQAWPLADEYARKAVAVGLNSSRAHALLGSVLAYQWRMRDAEREYERAVALDPNNADTHHWYSLLLNVEGKPDQALVEINRALELEPLSLAFKTDLGLSYSKGRRYAEAIAVLESVLKISPDFPGAGNYLMDAYLRSGQLTAALREADRPRGKQGQYSIFIHAAAAIHNRDRAALERILHGLQTPPKSAITYLLAKIYAQSGDKDTALRYLRQAADSHRIELIDMPTDAAFDSLHSDPEYETLRRQVLDINTAASPPTEMAASAKVPAQLR